MIATKYGVAYKIRFYEQSGEYILHYKDISIVSMNLEDLKQVLRDFGFVIFVEEEEK